MKLDVISVRKLDLSEVGLEGYIEFKGMYPRQVQNLQKKFEDLQKKGKDGEALDIMEEIVKEQFVGGKLVKGDKKESIDELGKMDVSMIYKCFEVISGSADLEKKVKSMNT